MSACFVFPGQSQAQEKPNVIFLYADDLGYADISFNREFGQFFTVRRHEYHVNYNFARTPHIDSIFESGVVLDNHLTHMVCSPSRAGLLTGRHFSEVGSSARVGAQVDHTVPNIARNFQNNDYVTAAFGKWHNSRDIGNSNVEGALRVLDFGFDEWAGYYGGGQDYFDRSTDAGWYMGAETEPRPASEDGTYTTYLLQDLAIDFIKRHKNDNFFLYVPWTAVHSPHHLTKTDLKDMCDYFQQPGNYGDYLGKDNLSHLDWETVRKITDNGHVIENYENLKFSGTGAEFDQSSISRDYPGFDKLVHATMVYAMDKAVGEILQTVVTEELMDNTIVVFSSDNGAGGGGDNGHFYGRKLTGWEGGHHVPTAIWWPGRMEASMVKHHRYPYMTQYLDWYPTLVAAAGIPLNPEADLDGINILEHLKNGIQARQSSESEKSFLTYDYFRNWNVIRNDDYVLHYNELQGQDRYVKLYSRAESASEDPNNEVNFANNPDYAAILTKMTNQLKDWYASGDVSTRFMKIPDNFHYFYDAVAAPEGEVMEIIIEQTADLNPAEEGLYMGFGTTIFPRDRQATDYIQPSDYLRYDICVAGDSDQVEGFVVSPSNLEISSVNGPHLWHNTGIGLEGIPLAQQTLPKGKWVRCVAGIGDAAPSRGNHIYLGFLSEMAGIYHVYLDNIAICKADGDVRVHVKPKNLGDFVYWSPQKQREVFKSFDLLKGGVTNLKYEAPTFATLDQPPHGPQGTIEFTSPTGGQIFQNGESIPVGVTTTGDGIQRVVLSTKLTSEPDSSYELVGRDFVSPYTWNVETLPAGSYRLRAVSYDSDDNTIAEGFASFVVQGDMYSLTVTSGIPTGTTTHAHGAVVDILADIAPEGMVFNGWTGDTGDVADAGSRNTTITMNANATIRATYVVSTNEPPVIDSLVAPATVQLGAQCTLTVIARDPNGAPMNFSWAATPPGEVTFVNPAEDQTEVWFARPGTYTLQITVSNRSSSTKESTTIIVTDPPNGETIVNFLSPDNNQQVTSDFQVKVYAYNAGGIKEVWLYSQRDGETGWESHDAITDGPYEWDISLADEGLYSLMATAVLIESDVKHRTTIKIEVSGTANNPPTVSFLSPSSDITNHTKGSQLSITAEANDTDGEITKLELSLDNDIIETLEGDLGTYEFGSLVLDEEGIHTIKLVATDSSGATSTAAVRQITVISDVAGDPAPPRSDDGDGCGCSTTEGTNGTVWLIALLILGMVIRQGYIRKLQ